MLKLERNRTFYLQGVVFMGSEKVFFEKLSAFKSFHMPRWNDLPEIDLYMDQVISVTDKYLGTLCTTDDPILTPSMINNYVKSGIIPSPVKKKYSREHLAKLLVICILKPVMEISAIAQIIERTENCSGTPRMLDDLADLFESRLRTLSVIITSDIENEEKTEDLLCAITAENAVSAGTEKIIANLAYASFSKKENKEKIEKE